jgi:hypothetical protein
MSSGDSIMHVPRWFVHPEFAEDESVIGVSLVWCIVKCSQFAASYIEQGFPRH